MIQMMIIINRINKKILIKNKINNTLVLIFNNNLQMNNKAQILVTKKTMKRKKSTKN